MVRVVAAQRPGDQQSGPATATVSCPTGDGPAAEGREQDQQQEGWARGTRGLAIVGWVFVCPLTPSPFNHAWH